MKTKLLFFICFWIAGLPAAWAQHFEPVKDPALLREKLLQSAGKIQTIQCSFTQEKNMSMLADKVISKGKFYFKTKGKVRLEYLQPVKNLIVLNKGKMLLQNEEKTMQMDMHRSRMFQQLNQIITGSIDGSLFSEKDFSAAYFENGSLVKVTLTPTAKALRNFISTIVMILDKKDFTAVRIEMNEPSGDNTVLSFFDKKINADLSDSLFAVK